MNNVEDLMTPARAAGSFVLFLILFAAFDATLSNLSIDAVTTLILVIVGVAAIFWSTGLIWNFVEGH